MRETQEVRVTLSYNDTTCHIRILILELKYKFEWNLQLGRKTGCENH